MILNCDFDIDKKWKCPELNFGHPCRTWHKYVFHKIAQFGVCSNTNIIESGYNEQNIKKITEEKDVVDVMNCIEFCILPISLWFLFVLKFIYMYNKRDISIFKLWTFHPNFQQNSSNTFIWSISLSGYDIPELVVPIMILLVVDIKEAT